MSMGPSASSKPSTAARAAAWSATSKARVRLPGSPVAAESSLAWSRPLRTTDAPASARPAASARPMPRDEPRGLGRAGADRVDAYAVGAHLGGEAAGVVDDRSLQGRVHDLRGDSHV